MTGVAPLLPLYSTGASLSQQAVDEINGNFYTKIASNFDAKTKQFQLSTALEVFIELLPQVKGVVFDLGSGDGRNTASLQNALEGDVIGIDYNEAMVDIARASYSGVTFRNSNILSDWAYAGKDDPNKSYGVTTLGVLASTVLDNLTSENLEVLFEGFSQSVVSGGVFYANYHRGSREGFALTSRYSDDGEMLARYRIEHEEDTVHAVLRNHGFTILGSDDIFHAVPQDKQDKHSLEKLTGAYNKVKDMYTEAKASVFAIKR